jgi:hypothetical protein
MERVQLAKGDPRMPYRRITAAERRAPIQFPVPESWPHPCIRCGTPVEVSRSVNVTSGQVAMVVTTVSVICDDCWVREG